MKSLIITEKPSVGRTFAETLHVTGNQDGYIENDKWIITWCVGHLIALSYPEAYDPALKEWHEETLPFLPSKYKYEIIKQFRNQFNIIKSLCNRKDVEQIYYAGDSAREGIYIQALVRAAVGHDSNVIEKVVWIHSQTGDEILRGIREAKPYSEYQNLIDSGYERAIEDYASGINFSRMLSVKYGRTANRYAGTKNYRPIAVGRVMTCVLGMVVFREREIESFQVTPFYKVISNVSGIEAEWKVIETSRAYQAPELYGDNGFREELFAADFIDTLPNIVTIEKIEKKIEKKHAPNLFNLAELQNECTKRFKLSPDKTLDIAQNLYEKKLTTYPRTDARVLSTAIAKEIRKNLSGISNKCPISDCASVANEIIQKNADRNLSDTRYTDDTKVSDHYAIIPTGEGFGNFSGLKAEEKNVLELILRRFLSIFLPPAEYNVVKLTEDAGGEKFFASTKILQSPGYLSVAGLPKDAKEPAVDLSSLTECKSYPAEYSIKKGETTPPKRYTSGSMVLAMENAGNLIEDEELRAQIKNTGIGTSSTRAETIKKLIKQEYLQLNPKTQVLTPAPMGNIIYVIVENTIPALLNPRMTASWEKGLEEIVAGRVSASEYRKKLEDYIRKEVNAIKTKPADSEIIASLEQYKGKNAHISKDLSVPCPICGCVLQTTKFGCICTKYKKEATQEELEEKKYCQFGIYQISGKTLSPDNIETLLSTGLLPETKGFKSKKGTPFSAALSFKTTVTDGRTCGEISFVFPEKEEPKESSISCPKCGTHMVKDTWNYTCACGYKLSHVVAKKAVGETEIKKLISDGRTDLIKGFVSKNGKKFDAVLVLDKDGKVQFEFQ